MIAVICPACEGYNIYWGEEHTFGCLDCGTGFMLYDAKWWAYRKPVVITEATGETNPNKLSDHRDRRVQHSTP